jgi:hypothetical protein
MSTPPKPKLPSARVSAKAITLLSLFIFMTSVAAGSGHAGSVKGGSFVHLSLTGKLSSPPPAQRQQPSASSQEDNIKKLAKDVVEKLAAEDFEGVRANFNEQLKEALPVEKIEQSWTIVTQQIGSFESQGPPKLVNHEGGRGIIIRCRFERGATQVEVWFDDENLVAGLWIRPA